MTCIIGSYNPITIFSKMFDDIEACSKLLITLSDGKPDYLDGYRGEYGIEDTRKALIEGKMERYSSLLHYDR